MAADPISNLAQNLTRHVRTEPRKAVILAGLLTAVGVMWTRIALFGGPTPAPAAPAPPEPTSAFAGSATAAANTAAMAALAEWNKGPISPPARNVFEVNLNYFPQDGSKVATSENVEGEGIWDALAKSLARRADQEKARRILVENLQAQAGKLELQSTVMSNGITKALVNGNLVGEGDTVGGFRVVRIEAKRIVVEREGVKLEVLFNF